MFLHVSVILSTGGVLQAGRSPPTRAGWVNPPPSQAGRTPRARQTPPGPGRPPRARQTPPARLGEPPPGQADTPPGPGRPPRARQTQPPPTHPTTPSRENPPLPPGEADIRIRSTSGRYASYWNAFLFCIFFAKNCMKMKKNWTEKIGSTTEDSKIFFPRTCCEI